MESHNIEKYWCNELNWKQWKSWETVIIHVRTNELALYVCTPHTACYYLPRQNLLIASSQDGKIERINIHSKTFKSWISMHIWTYFIFNNSIQIMFYWLYNIQFNSQTFKFVHYSDLNMNKIFNLSYVG